MTPESFIASKAVLAIKDLYNADIDASTLQVQVTRKEFEGDFTLVVFPLLRISHSTPDNTGAAIGGWFKANVPEISAFNVVKGFLNLSIADAADDLRRVILRGNVVDGHFPDVPEAVPAQVAGVFHQAVQNDDLHLSSSRRPL